MYREMISISHAALSVLLLVALCICSGCGTLTGLPGHGGGKRFAVEQELVSAATRGAIKQLDLSSLRGKRVNLFVNAIGDNGAGNLLGGRFSVVSQLRGDYIQTPATVERSVFPRYSSTTSSSTSSSTTSATQDASTLSSAHSATETMLNHPVKSTTSQEGTGGEAQLGLEYKGLGSYHNSEEIPSDDLQYLSALLQTYFFLKEVYVVPPSEAEIDVYITVDVFGTVRSRVDWFLANNEILRAKTVLEVLAVEHLSGRLVFPPRSAGAEAEYNEQYILWAGPVMIKETLTKAKPLLSTFTDLEAGSGKELRAEQDLNLRYPFQNQLKRDE
ncbi:hypothetical protein [Desulfogranum mediterraneum]|uniref:hypothetical protein n=1 Tax=Desulfogranum mediterraneum TaxID=160661 RepID=UPI0006848FD5|nr:hypothetical protein [Desulfogranum mediterraneum]